MSNKQTLLFTLLKLQHNNIQLDWAHGNNHEIQKQFSI